MQRVIVIRKIVASISLKEIVHLAHKIQSTFSSLKKNTFSLFHSPDEWIHIIPFTHADVKKKGKGFFYFHKEYVVHNTLPLAETAFKRFTRQQKQFLIVIGCIFLSSLVLWLKITLVILLGIMIAIYFFDLLFSSFLATLSFIDHDGDTINKKQLATLSTSSLPLYTILCPLYKEWQVLPQFIHAIERMDYPSDKLQVLLLLEEDDTVSQHEVKRMKLPSHFHIIIVPHSYPKTKPKALNYGLQYTKGEYLVIYDAEDRPDPLQLKKSIYLFKNSHEKIFCVQAKLNFYNTKQNILTRLFSLEYSLWFDLILPGLQKMNAPIPLGGTSNHFKVSNLHSLSGWDPFNVTEDADLGMRIYKRGYRTRILHSYTLEEATSNLHVWVKQRSRWIKGYIQTYFVHLRKNNNFSLDLHDIHIITFHLLFGGKVFALLVNPIMWSLTIVYFLWRPLIGHVIEQVFPPTIFYIGCFVLVVGNFLYFYFYFLAAARKKQWFLLPYAFLVPLYWICISYAAMHALREFILRPHHWNKTTHGFHLQHVQYLPVKEYQGEQE